MFKEATSYAPVIVDGGGDISVLFSEDHPGFGDVEYQRHRAGIARLALNHSPGDPVADVTYTEEEHETWRAVIAELREKHRRHACAEFLAGADRLDLPTDRLPQLGEVSERTAKLTGFTFTPAAGLVEQRAFYGSLADRRFQATQYVRHPTIPRFSPEPDMIHEIIGHGTPLSVDRWASLYELIGTTVRRLRTTEAVTRLSRVFWFALEYGLVREQGEIKAFGASLLSSCGELDQFQTAELRPLDVDAMVNLTYRVDDYQPVLFYAESFGHMESFLTEFFTSLER